jgi:putative transposase
MRKQKCSLDLYVNFLVASQKQYSGTELSKVSPDQTMAHDSVSRWLAGSKLTPKMLWQESQEYIEPKSGYIVLDDSVLDKPYARHIPLAKKQYSGKHHRVVRGIASVNLLWTDGGDDSKLIPFDYRIYDTTRDGKTKNDHGREMLQQADRRGFKPRYVLMDAWYTSIGNLKAIDALGWKWVGQIKCNRLVNIEQGNYVHVADLDWTSKQVHKVWLKAYGFVLVSKIVSPNGDTAYIATNDLSLDNPETIKNHYNQRWTIETFHRGLKQCTGVERCYSRIERSQRNHILCAFLAFLKLERERIQNMVSWYEQANSIARPAVTAYLVANA